MLSSLKVGGAERLVLRLARTQRDVGHDARILALADGPLVDELPALRVPFQIVRARSMWDRALACGSFFERGRFHVINSHNPSAHRMGGLARVTGSAAVMTFHGSGERDLGFVVHRRWSDALIAVSTHSRTAFLSRHDRSTTSPVFVVPNGVSVPRPSRGRAELRRELGIAEDEVCAIIVARLDPLKDHETLIQAVGQARDAGTGVTLLVAGDGERRAAIEQAIARFGVSDRVRMLGFRRDVADLLAASDLFVLSSISEGLPLAALEAMAVSLPVIATDVGGTREVVRDEITGLVVPARSPSALARALARLARDANARTRFGCAGRRVVDEEFSLETMARRYEEIYRQSSSTRRW